MKDLTIIVKTLDRYNCLKALIKSVLKKYPQIRIIIGDDSIQSYEEQLRRDFPNKKNIKFYRLPYDSGASKGRNLLVEKVKTKYFCLCDDDFVFDSKTNLEECLEILKEKDLDILGGYVRNYKIINSKKDYLIRLAQRILHYELPTNYIGTFKQNNRELYVDYRIKEFPKYQETDLVVQFFIAKTASVLKSPWDDDLKIEEHTAFFYSAKKNGLKVAFTNKLSVRHCPVHNSKYKNFRTRSYIHVFMEKNNIEKIISTYDIKERNHVTVLPKNKDIFISIIVPCYNCKNKVDLLIKTLKEQTYKNFEVIMVDNNSTDGTKEYLKNLIKGDKRFRILSEKKQGPNYARKKGFDYAKGEYVYFCDCDDYLEDDTLYHFVCEISKNKSDVVIANYIEYNGMECKLMKGIFQNYDGNLKDYKDIVHVKPALWNKIFKKSLIDENSFVFTMIGEDMFVTVLAMLRAKKITYINKVVYHYVLEENGLSSKVSYKNILNWLDTQAEIKKSLDKINMYEQNKEEIDYIFITHLVYRIFRIVLLEDKKERKEAYNLVSNRLKTISSNNVYLKKSKAFSLAYRVVTNKVLYNVSKPFIKLLFTNKFLNKIFKKLDK